MASRAVQAYLRFEQEQAVGVVASRDCNVLLDRQGRRALCGGVEAVNVWNLRQGALEKALVVPNSSARVARLCLFEGSKVSRCAVGRSVDLRPRIDHESGGERVGNAWKCLDLPCFALIWLHFVYCMGSCQSRS